jgi:glycosyltransferase involved in cell wall biosynthesis
MPPPALAPLPTTVDGPRPAVSIVMPTYRRAHHVGASIGSLLRQTFADFELIVQDDASPDDTQAVVASTADARVRYFRNPRNLRMPANLNAGLRQTRGRFVLVCHDHDLYEPDLVERMVAVLSADGRIAYVHAGVGVIDEGGTPTGRTYVGDYPARSDGVQWARYMVTRFDSPVCANTMVPRSVYEQAGLYDPDFGFVSDVEMWLRLALAGDVGYIARPLIGVREREPGHEYFSMRWEVTDTMVRMLRLYHTRAFSGAAGGLRSALFRARVEAHLLRGYLSALKRRDWADGRRARAYFRRSPTIVCRAVGYLG